MLTFYKEKIEGVPVGWVVRLQLFGRYVQYRKWYS